MPLTGSADLQWGHRFNLASAQACAMMDWFSLATAAALWYRVRRIPLATHIFLAVACTGFLANILWRSLNRDSWHRNREYLAAFLRLGGFGFGVGWILVYNFVDGISPATGGGLGSLAWQAMLLLLASATSSLVSLFARPIRINMAVPIQLALVLDGVRRSPNQCTAGGLALATPLGQKLTRDLYAVLSTLRFPILPSGHHLASLSPGAECAIMISYIQLSLAFALPLLIQAAMEARLFKEHQRQRQLLGLPPESGLHARLYAAISHTVEHLEWHVMLLFAWMLLGILFDCAVLLVSLSLRGEAGAQQQ